MSVASCDRKGEIIALSSEITKIIAMANMRKTSRKGYAQLWQARLLLA